MPNELEQKIINLINEGGALTVAQFMELALTDEEYGYYRKKDPFADGGDFITSPEISQMFGELVGAWIAAQWGNSSKPSDFAIVELGAGRGTLMSDILRATSKIKEFQNPEIHIIEINDTLKSLQARRLEKHSNNISWHDDINNLPEKPIFLVANEFFDALPIHQFKKTEKGWREKLLTIDNDGNLKFKLCPDETPACEHIPKDYNEMEIGRASCRERVSSPV